MRVGADHVGQHVRIGRVALGARYAQAFPIPCRLQRIDRQHRVSGRQQRLHPRAAVGFDPHQHFDVGGLHILTNLPSDHRVQLGHPRHSLEQTACSAVVALAGVPADRNIAVDATAISAAEDFIGRSLCMGGSAPRMPEPLGAGRSAMVSGPDRAEGA
ncbi:hypothetical protein GCM10010404_77530 [Nonomuraea africana]|uniref:Uncharacterized protein n=1 Tax=Nonomuraea africana TaxID=46171 RepID=A0ABR9KE02_9ACTN|nr:hypothetical protein [Nonomuraea africana]